MNESHDAALETFCIRGSTAWNDRMRNAALGRTLWLGLWLGLLGTACGAGEGDAAPTSGGMAAVGGAPAGSLAGSTNLSGNGSSLGSAGAGGSGNSGNGAGAATSVAGHGGNAAGSSNAGGSGHGGAGGSVVGSGNGGAGGTVLSVPAGYELVWHDEFDVDGAPNPANWKFEKGFARNEEAQWYQADNASVKGGLLVIEARKERVKNPNYTGSGDWKTSREYAEYTSSSLLTSGLQSFQYGRFEMRGRIPTSAGMWPAWWTLGVSGEWPSNGEIDIMEFYQGKVLANVACGTGTRWQAKWDSATKSLSSLGANWSSEFHVWRMDWDDQNIVLYLDDQEMNSSPLSSMLNSDGKSPFKQKAYMMANLAIGGANGGDPSKTAFPQRYELDYIRVFQKM
jgi:beta-glucanase (GH16 family)